MNYALTIGNDYHPANRNLRTIPFGSMSPPGVYTSNRWKKNKHLHQCTWTWYTYMYVQYTCIYIIDILITIILVILITSLLLRFTSNLPELQPIWSRVAWQSSSWICPHLRYSWALPWPQYLQSYSAINNRFCQGFHCTCMYSMHVYFLTS